MLLPLCFTQFVWLIVIEDRVLQGSATPFFNSVAKFFIFNLFVFSFICNPFVSNSIARWCSCNDDDEVFSCGRKQFEYCQTSHNLVICIICSPSLYNRRMKHLFFNKGVSCKMDKMINYHVDDIEHGNDDDT